MKDKLRSILHTAWNEPRHFFFWLAMLSLCGFAAVALGLALAGPALWLAFAALGCILCFLISIPAFILAWIPPVRRLLSWLLQRRFLVLGCLVTLVALFYAIENWRGRRAWQNYKREWEAKGERFDLASLAPPPVPADQNFFETPLWSDLRFVATNGTVVWSETNRWGPRHLQRRWPQGQQSAQPRRLAEGRACGPGRVAGVLPRQQQCIRCRPNGGGDFPKALWSGTGASV